MRNERVIDKQGKNMNKTSNAKLRANRKWNCENLDKITVSVPKGQKDIIKAMAESKGESLNSYVGKAIQRQLEEDQKHKK